MRVASGVLFVALHLGLVSPQAGSVRIVIAEGGKHRLLTVDRESHAVLKEKNDFTRVDCLVALAADDLLVCDKAQFVRLDADLIERSRTPVGFERVNSVTAVGGNQFLVSDTERNAIVWIDALGNPRSSIRVHYPSNVATRLRDRLLVADGTRTLKTFQRDGTLVSELGLTRWAASLDVATSGGLLVGESLGYERFDATGRRVWFRPSPSRVSCIQQLAGDEILLCEPDAHRVRIVDREGTTVWAFADLDYAWRAVYVQ